MTLFYMTIDSVSGRLAWVRAGHDPAILYDPVTQQFDELRGEGMALGVDSNWQYVENHKAGLAPGQIIFLGTDGIWETHNSQGGMFGKKSVCNLISQNASFSAEEIVNRVVNELDIYRGNQEPEDDVTLVAIKIAPEFPLSY